MFHRSVGVVHCPCVILMAGGRIVTRATGDLSRHPAMSTARPSERNAECFNLPRILHTRGGLLASRAMERPAVRLITPLLIVSDLRRSIDFYTGKLAKAEHDVEP